jgi:thymidylate synthase ThyX
MAYHVKVILDSVAPSGYRLTTIEATYPRIIHAEFMTHRVCSRNAASSRAIPVKKLLNKIIEDPFIPENFGINKSGMQAEENLSNEDALAGREIWLKARDDAYAAANKLALDLGVHKQLANRLIEPFSWITVIITATDWQNFFKLRCNPDAQPEFQKIANMIREAYTESTPNLLAHKHWHTPYIQPDEMHLDSNTKVKIATARCARVSYLTHDGQRNYQADLDLYNRLLTGNHWSPFEHCATPLETDVDANLTGNFSGWIQYRKTFNNECAPENHFVF